jgi:hypothetical protein
MGGSDGRQTDLLVDFAAAEIASVGDDIDERLHIRDPGDHSFDHHEIPDIWERSEHSADGEGPKPLALTSLNFLTDSVARGMIVTSNLRVKLFGIPEFDATPSPAAAAR